MENEFEKIEELLFSEAKRANPSPDELKAVLLRLPEDVTTKIQARYKYLKANKGRASNENLIQHINNIMNSFWKVAVPIGLVVVVVAAIGYWRINTAPSNRMAAEQKTAAPAEFASQDVNSAIDEIMESAAQDVAVINTEGDDAAYGDSDSDAVVAFDSVTSIYEQ